MYTVRAARQAECMVRASIPGSTANVFQTILYASNGSISQSSTHLGNTLKPSSFTNGVNQMKPVLKSVVQQAK